MRSLAVFSTISGISFPSLALTVICASLLLGTLISSAQAQNVNAKKPTIVLVHGAYADGSSWSKVIPQLQAKGYTVISVQNPLTSLADDVAATNRVINQQTEPVLLVGHSWAGVVITEAGNNPKVKGLVYVSGIAPDSGQSLVDAAAGFPPSVAPVNKDEGGFLYLPEASYLKYFAPDIPLNERRVLAATQAPWFSGCLTDKVTKAAWRDKPSWWVIGENDQMVNPKLQEKMAANIKAKVTKVPTSHVVLLADPKTVTDVIITAADKIQSEQPENGAVPTAMTATTDNRGNPTPVTPLIKPFQERTALSLNARDVRGPAPVIPLVGEEPPAKLIVDPPLAEALARGLVVIQYRTENLRIVPVYGPAALAVSPRVGHLHITVDDGPWRWLDASNEPININKLSPGSHKILIELVNANHQPLDRAVVQFEIPKSGVT